jgi:hypothetical protein
MEPSRTFAGLAGVPGSQDGMGSEARFDGPGFVGVDSADNVYIADSNNDTIRKITPDALVSTFAGLAGVPGSQDGTGSDARFNGPTGVTVGPGDNLYVGDIFKLYNPQDHARPSRHNSRREGRRVCRG